MSAAPTIAFVGFMASGKTRAAERTAAALGEPVADADAVLAGELGEPIEDFFEREGEAAFRRREERLALSLLDRGGVVSLGGGAIESGPVRAALEGCLTVWCRVREATAWDRAHGGPRPLARDRKEFARRFAAREPLFDQVARAVLPLDRARDAATAAAPWLRAVSSIAGARMAWARLAGGEYPAVVGEGALGLLADGSWPGDAPPQRWFCVADALALRHQGDRLPPVEATIEVEGGEGAKTLAEAERVLRQMARAGARRDDAVLAYGGGVVGDLAGFCAATYQRGVPVVQAPTTLVAQVDAAYGGKTGVDLPEAKNYAGAYHQPRAVLAEPGTLATLAGEEMAAGFAEVLKTALIAGGPLWQRVRGLESLEPDELADVVFACARTKLDVVAEDERDQGRRAVLNLGHTVGHGIETAAGYGRLRHGEAVGLGLLAALRVSGADGLRDEVAGLLARHGLPVALDPAISTEEVLAAAARDKKRSAEGIGFVVCERPGQVRAGVDVDADSLRAAVEELRA